MKHLSSADSQRGGRSKEAPKWLENGAFDALLQDIASGAAERDRSGSFPFQALDGLEELGVTRLTAPSSHGGEAAGLDLARHVIGRLGAADPSVALVVLWQFVFLADLNRRHHGWPEEARSAVLDNRGLINALNVEPDLGSPARGGLPATRATRQSDGSWLVSGRKIYATGIPALRWLLVSVTVDDGRELRPGQILIDAKQQGVRVEETWDHVGLRASASHDVVFQNARTPESFLVSDELLRKETGKGDFYAGERHIWACVLVSALYDGIARSSRQWLFGYLNHRVPSNLGAPLVALPRFQTAAGQIELHLQTSERLLRDIAVAVDAGTDEQKKQALTYAPLLKHIVTSNAIAVTSTALELTGNPGHSRHNPLERHHRDALTGRIHTPQPDFALLNAGKAVLASSYASGVDELRKDSTAS